MKIGISAINKLYEFFIKFLKIKINLYTIKRILNTLISELYLSSDRGPEK